MYWYTVSKVRGVCKGHSNIEGLQEGLTKQAIRALRSIEGYVGKRLCSC